MRLLLDTNILIWSLSNPEKLSKEAKNYLTQADLIFVSAISLWEIHIKAKLGKIQMETDNLIPSLQQSKIKELPITWEHTFATRNLPLYHRDPFDRMLIAQAMSEPLILLTHDQVLVQYGDLVKYF